MLKRKSFNLWQRISLTRTGSKTNKIRNIYSVKTFVSEEKSLTALYMEILVQQNRKKRLAFFKLPFQGETILKLK